MINLNEYKQLKTYCNWFNNRKTRYRIENLLKNSSIQDNKEIIKLSTDINKSYYFKG